MLTFLLKQILACVLLFGVAGCRAEPQTWVRSELYFGLTIPGGGEVTDAQWQEFVDQQITPRFPDGLTILTAQGQWREETGVVRHEPSRVLILLSPPDSLTSGKIEEIRTLYKQQFHQEAVMEITTPARVEF